MNTIIDKIIMTSMFLTLFSFLGVIRSNVAEKELAIKIFIWLTTISLLSLFISIITGIWI